MPATKSKGTTDEFDWAAPVKHEWPPESTGRYATDKDVAYFLQVTPAWVKDARKGGVIRANKISHKVVRYDKRKIEAWVESTLEAS